MRSIAIANHKGGVGKSTTAVSLAAGLARAGHRTLLVDTDAQANATSIFIPEDHVQLDLRTAIQALIIDGGPTVAEVIQPSRIDGLDVLPSSLDVARLDIELVAEPGGERLVRQVLRRAADDYEYAVLDLAPSLSILTLASLAAADYAIVPVSATRWGTRGLFKFLMWMEEFRVREVIDTDLLGVLVTMVDPRTRIARDVLDGLRTSRVSLPLFQHHIPKRVAVEDHIGYGMVAGDAGSDPTSPAPTPA